MSSTTSTSKKPQNVANSSSIPVITCKCGAQILLVPDVKAMSKAIEAHLKSHKAQDKALSEADLDRLRDNLIAEIFGKFDA